jgi:GNAT superfamily N-acetyltransferase
MSQGLKIVPAGQDDREALLALLAAQFTELEIQLPAEKLAAAVDGALLDPIVGGFMIARIGDSPVAVAYLSFQWSLEHGGMSAWLEELYVIPEQRGGGIGRKLLHAACHHAAERGCAAVDLEVEEAHPRATHLYEREGFRPHRRLRWVKQLG